MSIERGVNFVDCDFPQLMLSAGSFVIGAGLAMPNMEWLDNQPHAAAFEVYPRDTFDSGFAPTANRYPIAMDHFWNVPTPDELATQVLHRGEPQLMSR